MSTFKDFLTKKQILTKNQLGMTLIEVLISVAILGVVVVTVVTQSRMAFREGLSSAADAEINNVMNRVISEIGNEKTCSRNFRGNNPTNGYASLVDAAGVNILVGDNATPISAGQSEILVSSIATEAVSDNEMKLILNFRKKNNISFFNLNSIKREILLSIEKNGANVDYCFANFDLIIRTAIRTSCDGNSSQYDATINPPYGACVHKNNDLTCPAGQFLSNVAVSPANATYTCTDIIPGGVLGCATPGQFLYGFNADGSMRCDYLFVNVHATGICAAGDLLVKNAAGQYVCKQINCTAVVPPAAFGGFDANGNVICNQIHDINTCGVDNFVSKVDAIEGITCNPAAIVTGSCPAGQKVQGINAAGVINCQPFINLPFDCGAGWAVDRVDAAGNVQCKRVDRPLACDGTRTAHTYTQCTGAGGSVANSHTNSSQCVFGGASCPGGWTRCQNWGVQTTNTCTDTASTWYCTSMIQTRNAVPTSFAFSNFAQTSTTCHNWVGAPNSGSWYWWPAQYHTCAYGGSYAPIYSNQTQVGCY